MINESLTLRTKISIDTLKRHFPACAKIFDQAEEAKTSAAGYRIRHSPGAVAVQEVGSSSLR